MVAAGCGDSDGEDGGSGCAVGESGVACGDGCVDTDTDAAHCGACDAACAPGAACVAGVCQTACGATQTECGGACTDTAADTRHCGACGNACEPGEVCFEGACATSCPDNFDTCSGTCVDTEVDPANCGMCGGTCDGGEVCSGGECATSCQEGLVECGGRCVDTDEDRLNCGGCGDSCGVGEVCSDGACATSCQDGLTECDGICVSTDSDRDNCGRCGESCSAGAVCSEGTCALSCQEGLTECGGGCVDVDDDRDNCGRCGEACDAGEICSEGVCALSCQEGLTECGGECVELAEDRDHCGACGEACASGEVCSAGDCALSCQDGLSDCDGGCVDLDDDRDHCGECGVACVAGEICTDGDCVTSCQDGLTDCAGSCVDLEANDANCGGCAIACAADEVCSGGDCVGTTPVDLQILSISDWHAQLDPVAVGGVQVGGAAVLSSYFQAERAIEPNTLTLTAGDAYGGSPPLSGFFEEEPAVLAMNLMGFDADTFGNHNFDRGIAHLQSMIDLAEFQYVSSNLVGLSNNLTGVAEPFHLVDMGGVRVAIIGITNEDAPELVTPGGMGSLTVADAVASAMNTRALAEAAGARVFVAAAHLGATAFNAGDGTWTGPLIDFAEGIEGFHVVVGDHTNIAVNTVVNDALVVENLSKGVSYARIRMQVVPLTGVVISRSAEIVSPLASGVTPDPAVEAMLAPFREQLAAELDGVIGIATDIFVRGSNIERLQEVPIGNLVADSMRLRYGTQLAFTNGGGIRAPLPSAYLPEDTTLRRNTAGYAAGPPYDLVRGDVFTTLPFGNVVVTRTVTGTQLWAMVEHGISALPAANGRFGQISGFRFTYDVNAQVGSRLVSMALADGTPIPEDATTYTLATSDFLNMGGDGYTMLNDGAGTTRDVMADVLVDYIEQLDTITPTVDGRITAVTP